MPSQSGTQDQRNVLHAVGWGVSGLAVAFLLLDATMKLLALPMVLEANAALGFESEHTSRVLGVILLICTVIYAVPSTAVLGAILLTAYLGGAVAAHLRVHDPLLTHVLSGVYGGVLVWGGVYLRDTRSRAFLLPLRLRARDRLPPTP